MSQRRRAGDTVYSLISGRRRIGGQICTIKKGLRKGGLEIVLSEKVPETSKNVFLLISGNGDEVYNYLIVNYADKPSEKLYEKNTTGIALNNVVSLYFYCFGGSATIMEQGDVVKSANNGAAEYTSVPITSNVQVSFTGTGYSSAKTIKVTWTGG